MMQAHVTRIEKRADPELRPPIGGQGRPARQRESLTAWQRHPRPIIGSVRQLLGATQEDAMPICLDRRDAHRRRFQFGLPRHGIGRSADDPVRLGQVPSLVFAPSMFVEAERRADGRADVNRSVQ